MGDLFYRMVRLAGRGPVGAATARLVIGESHIPPRGAAILASSHLSPFDVPALIGAASRPIDWLSITELMSRPGVGWFFRKMNAFPLDRSRHDPRATRTLLERLQAGRLVGVFPEGRIRRPAESVISGGGFSNSILRVSRASGAPIVPAVVLGVERLKDPLAWLPTGQTHYGVIFGEAMVVPPGAGAEELAEASAELRRRYGLIASQLRARMGGRLRRSPAI